MIKGQRVEGADITMADEEEIVRFQGPGLQLAWLALVLHGLVGIVHVREINMTHGLAYGLVAVDTAERLVIEEEDTNLKDERH